MEKSSKDEAEDDERPLELKPLLSLAPMFPAPMGYDVATQSTDPQIVYVTPFRPCPSSERPGQPAPAPSARPSPRSPGIPPTATPIPAAFPTPQHQDGPSEEDRQPSGEQNNPASLKTAARRARRRAAGGSDAAANAKRRSTRRSLNKELDVWPSSSDKPRDSAEAMMMVFDSLRRRVLQLDEKGDAGRRADLKAGALMMRNNLRINSLKIVGPVPGLEIGDIFFFRIEMCIVGLHAPAMAGIDYLPASHAGKDETLAVSIVSSGGYENDEGDADTLVYTGHGGSSRRKGKHDQKLERGNLALMNSANKKNQIRVVRSAPDPFCSSGKIYVYDGLYRVEGSWMDKAKSGFSVFKYRLRREPGQPAGIALWKTTEKWRANPASREKVITLDLSSKIENLPVCLVNGVDDGVQGPSRFEYVTGAKYSRPLGRKKPLQSCRCPSVCLPGDAGCSCARRNGGDLPYSSSGLLVKRVPTLYECSSDCRCSQDCRNRTAQKGVRLNLEVFRTGDRGWGLRSWDAIRAGAFVCEYAGEVVDETRTDMDDDEDGYAFRASWPPNDKVSRWNLGAELLEEKSTVVVAAESFERLPIVVSAKNSGNVARFLNHSCSPNLLWQAVQYDHGDDSYPHIMFFAMKHIAPMTELTYDYGTRGAPPGIGSKLLNACKLKPCLCGSANCRGSF